MKAKIALTQEQVNQLVEIEEKQLRTQFEKDLAAIRKKYEVVEIDLDNQSQVRKSKKSKLTDEEFKKYLNKNMSISEVAELTGYNASYLNKRKKLLTGAVK